jgi:hypothetical protein
VNSVKEKMSHTVSEGSDSTSLFVLNWLLLQDDRGRKSLTKVLICT